jgi:hypothetical protein
MMPYIDLASLLLLLLLLAYLWDIDTRERWIFITVWADIAWYWFQFKQKCNKWILSNVKNSYVKCISIQKTLFSRLFMYFVTETYFGKCSALWNHNKDSIIIFCTDTIPVYILYKSSVMLLKIKIVYFCFVCKFMYVFWGS